MELSDLTQNILNQKLSDKNLNKLVNDLSEWCDNESDASLEEIEKRTKNLEVEYKKSTGKELVTKSKTGDSLFDDVDPDLLD